MEKIELIHFHTKRSIDNNNYSISIRNNQIKPKNLVRWLGIWLDSKLSFKEHVEIKIAEATISQPKVRFNRICKNYALRIMQISKNHSIRLRVSSSFPPYNNEVELDWEKYLDWNEKNQSIETEIAEISSELESR